MLRFFAALMLGFVAGAGLVTFYWWLSDQQQAEALEGWEWQQRNKVDTAEAGRTGV